MKPAFTPQAFRIHRIGIRNVGLHLSKNESSPLPPIVKEGIGILKTDGTIVDIAEMEADRSLIVAKENVAAIAYERNGLCVAIHPESFVAYFSDGKRKCAALDGLPGWSAAIYNSPGGEYNTEKLLTTLGNVPQWAVRKCYDTLINGKHCFLPSLGELHAIRDDIERIKQTLDIVGFDGSAVFPDNASFWSSDIAEKSKNPNDPSEESLTEDWYLLYMFGCIFPDNFQWGLNVQGTYRALPMTHLD